jgi:hypothetical protein
MADRLVLPTDLYVAPGDAPEQQPDQLQLLTQIVQQLAAQVETLSVATASTKPTTSAIPTADSDSAAGGRLELDALPADSKTNPLEYIDPREWSEFASRTFADCLPPSGTTAPCLWNPRHDEADKFFTDNARISSRDEYRHLLCYGVFTAAVNAALETAMETLRSVTSTPDETTYAYSLVDAALRTNQAVASAGEARLTYIRRFKAKKILTGEERVAERLVYSRCFDTVASDRGGNVVDGLLAALEDKRLEVSITAAAKAQAAAQFKADKPRPDKPDRPNDKPDKPDKTKAKPKDRTSGRPLPPTDKAHKKTEGDKDE